MRQPEGHLRFAAEDASVRVVVLGHAGASATSFVPLMRALPETCETCLLEPTPRGGPARSATSADGWADGLDRATRVVGPLIDRPTVLVGHSLGGLLAHGLVARLAERRALVRAVVISGSFAPGHAERRADAHGRHRTRRDHDSLVAVLEELGGCPPELFAVPEMLEATLDTLGADLLLADSYRAPRESPSADGPAYHVWWGRQDPVLAPSDPSEWVAVAAGPTSLREFAGGHFFLLEAEARAALRELVATVVDETEHGDAGHQASDLESGSSSS